MRKLVLILLFIALAQAVPQVSILVNGQSAPPFEIVRGQAVTYEFSVSNAPNEHINICIPFKTFIIRGCYDVFNKDIGQNGIIKVSGSKVINDALFSFLPDKNNLVFRVKIGEGYTKEFKVGIVSKATQVSQPNQETSKSISSTTSAQDSKPVSQTNPNIEPENTQDTSTSNNPVPRGPGSIGKLGEGAPIAGSAVVPNSAPAFDPGTYGFGKPLDETAQGLVKKSESLFAQKPGSTLFGKNINGQEDAAIGGKILASVSIPDEASGTVDLTVNLAKAFTGVVSIRFTLNGETACGANISPGQTKWESECEISRFKNGAYIATISAIRGLDRDAASKRLTITDEEAEGSGNTGTTTIGSEPVAGMREGSEDQDTESPEASETRPNTVRKPQETEKPGESQVKPKDNLEILVNKINGEGELRYNTVALPGPTLVRETTPQAAQLKRSFTDQLSPYLIPKDGKPQGGFQLFLNDKREYKAGLGFKQISLEAALEQKPKIKESLLINPKWNEKTVSGIQLFTKDSSNIALSELSSKPADLATELYAPGKSELKLDSETKMALVYDKGNYNVYHLAVRAAVINEGKNPVFDLTKGNVFKVPYTGELFEGVSFKAVGSKGNKCQGDKCVGIVIDRAGKILQVTFNYEKASFGVQSDRFLQAPRQAEYNDEYSLEAKSNEYTYSGKTGLKLKVQGNQNLIKDAEVISDALLCDTPALLSTDENSKAVRVEFTLNPAIKLPAGFLEARAYIGGKYYSIFTKDQTTKLQQNIQQTFQLTDLKDSVLGVQVHTVENGKERIYDDLVKNNAFVYVDFSKDENKKLVQKEQCLGLLLKLKNIYTKADYYPINIGNKLLYVVLTPNGLAVKQGEGMPGTYKTLDCNGKEAGEDLKLEKEKQNSCAELSGLTGKLIEANKDKSLIELSFK